MDGKLTQEEALRLLRARTLSVWEDAALLREYIRLCGITQSECAVRLGRSQSSVANRLRLLRLTDGERRAMQEAGLSERHARALLRLGDAAQRQAALRTVLQQRMSVAETEGYVETLLRSAGTPGARRAAFGGAPSAGRRRVHGWRKSPQAPADSPLRSFFRQTILFHDFMLYKRRGMW